ncbi:hypothetical protein B6N60_01477 [Richelia sinica FACHB-800]|uniref:Uncharacterized protein n=1 Tax=Richelia sinica FACHB-800 TaxID=1357546 RepID=A0A975T5U4_9NOST|nr:hypothetical protein [Richelia sinica]MBD2663648.1 hypothetical protein [Richelia sinica FACHB-800]QXE22791.1 hypothetical protein B6N60_01477 [Richelia sinica FACHB-800]
MNENFGKPARTGVCLRQAARTGVWLRAASHLRNVGLKMPEFSSDGINYSVTPATSVTSVFFFLPPIGYFS